MLEIGSGNGASTVSLARRCHQLDAIDGAEAAVRLTRRRMEDRPRCRVWRAGVPDDLPTGPYDAVVATEILYYLPPYALDRTLMRIGRMLTPSGRLVVTASLRPFDDREVGNERLFAIIQTSFGPARRQIAGGAWRLAVHARPATRTCRPAPSRVGTKATTMNERSWVRE